MNGFNAWCRKYDRLIAAHFRIYRIEYTKAARSFTFEFAKYHVIRIVCYIVFELSDASSREDRAYKLRFMRSGATKLFQSEEDFASLKPLGLVEMTTTT